MVGVLGRFANRYPLGRFRIYVTDAKAPLELGIPEAIADIVTTLPDARSEAQKNGLAGWLAENDAEYQKRRFALRDAERAVIPPDKKMEGLQNGLKLAELPIVIDPRLVRFRKDVEMSAGQAKNPRLTAAQDLTWALINNPAFLFNH